MATQKKAKAELIAIYRLEFYKKQKNWKLSSDTRRQKELQKTRSATPVKNSKKLNETYCIESKTEDEASFLNDAFLKDESDKEPPIASIHSSLNTQSLEPIHACQECLQADKPQNPWADYVDNVDGLAGPDCVNQGSGDGNEFEGFDGRAESMVWTNSAMSEMGWIENSTLPAAECPQRLLCAAEDWLSPWSADEFWAPDTQQWGEDEVSVCSLESVEEFLLGAHGAPHSSELELAAPPEAGEWRLSGAALAAAVRRHCGSLRRLLREQGRRRRHRSTLSLDMCVPARTSLAPGLAFNTEYSYDAFPTRDLPSTPLSPLLLSKNTLTRPYANMSKDIQSPHNTSKDRLAPLSPGNFPSDAFKLPPKKSEVAYTPVSSLNRCMEECTPFSPANLYREGFLAGSHRNKPVRLVGRGRGRLQDEGGVNSK